MKQEDIAKLVFADIIKAIEETRKDLMDLGMNCKIEFPNSVVVNGDEYVFAKITHKSVSP